MGMSKTERRRFRKDVKEGGDRSPLFWWLVDHAEELTRERAARRIAWEKHCARFERLGILDATGNPPSVATARKTWWRVRKFLADHPPPDGPPGVAHRSRAKATWQPPVAARPDASPAQADWLPPPKRNLPQETGGASRDRQPITKQEAAARIKALQRTFAQRSGH